jgi:acetyl-CoA carboxylase biotin carboxyl carrier protein
MDYKEIKSVLDLMTRHGLSEFELEKPDFKIRLKKSSGDSVPTVVYSSPIGAPAPVSVAPAASSALASNAPAAAPAGDTKDIVSPMVGTFYRSPSPDSAPYIEPGQAVTEDTVVCIIEAMKVMNEIKAEIKGIVTEVLAENGKPVEFGKPLYRVKPA